MLYTIDYSMDGYEWEEYIQSCNCLETTLHMAEELYQQGYGINVWDQDERLLWRSGISQDSPFYRESRQQEEWVKAGWTGWPSLFPIELERS